MPLEYPNKIALDTNVLIAINKLKIDIFKQIIQHNPFMKILVPKQVIQELKTLENNPKTKKHAKIALKTLSLHNIKIQQVNARSADQALIKLSQNKIIIATNDKILKKQIKEKQGKIAYIRKKTILSFD